MSYVRKHFTVAELASPPALRLTWPAVSITLLCLFAQFLGAAFVTGLNFYLLLLAGLWWLGTRRTIEQPIPGIVLPFVAMIAIGLIGGVGSDRYLYLKDAWYVSNPATVLLVGFVLGRLLGEARQALRAFVVAGVLLAALHLSVFALHPDLLLRDATRIRAATGNGYGAAALALALLAGWVGRWRAGLGLPGLVAAPALLICATSFVASFSRTLTMVLVIYLLAMTGWFARREWLRIGAVVLVVIVALSVLRLGVDTESASARRSFVGKLARSLDEIAVDEYTTRAEINENWRGFETQRGIDTWAAGSVTQLIFGHGFGKQADLGLFQHLSLDPRETVRQIPVFHNGYVFLLLKTGIVGVALYLGTLLWIYRVGRASAAGPPGEAATLEGRALQGSAVVLMVTTYVVAGALNKFDMFAFVLATGVLLAVRTRTAAPR